MKHSKVLTVVVAVLSILAGCNEQSTSQYIQVARPQVDPGTDIVWQQCNYTIGIKAETRYTDLLQVMNSNKLQFCGWKSASQIVAFRSNMAPVDCNLENIGTFDVVTERGANIAESARKCHYPEPRAPQNWERESLESYCFKMRLTGGVVAGPDDLLGTGSTLQHNFGLPIRFVSLDGDHGILWVDFGEYPWRDTFLSDVRSAAEAAGWEVDIASCT
jgi:hypothetical protein